MNDPDAVLALGALAQPSRLQAFRRLVVAGPTGETPGQMAEAMGITAAALSFHLKGLSHAALVTQERHGRHLVYRARLDTMNALLGYLGANCCQGQPCLDHERFVCSPS